jgi:hypothetical protein
MACSHTHDIKQNASEPQDADEAMRQMTPSRRPPMPVVSAAAEKTMLLGSTSEESEAPQEDDRMVFEWVRTLVSERTAMSREVSSQTASYKSMLHWCHSFLTGSNILDRSPCMWSVRVRPGRFPRGTSSVWSHPDRGCGRRR